MKKTPFQLFLAFAIFFVSCKSSITWLAIPKDAALVVHIDGKSISSKLSWNDIKSTDWFKKEYEQQKDDYEKKLMDDPEASGVDIKSDFAFFIEKVNNGGYLSFQGNLKDATAFEKFITTKEKEKKVEKSGDISFIKAEHSSLLAWNAKKFMFLADNGGMVPRTKLPMQEDYQPHTLSVDTLLIIAKDLFDLKSDKSLNDDSRFTALLKESGDLHFWARNDEFYSGMAGGMFSMLKLGDLLKNNVSASTVSFDNGKITINSKAYLNDELAKIFKEHKADPVSDDIINRIPSQNVAAVFAMNIPSDGLKAFLQASGLDGIANVALTKMGTNIDEITTAYKGPAVFALTDLSVKEVPEKIEGMDYSYSTKKPEFNYLAAIAVKNKPTFEKLLDSATTNFLHDSSEKQKFQYKLTDQWFVTSSSTQYANNFLAGGNNKFAFTSRISGHPYGVYIDLRKIIPVATSFFGMKSDSSSAQSVWQDIVFTGGEFKDNAITGNGEINFTDKSTNSLKLLFNYFSNMAHSFMKPREEVMDQHNLNDSTTIVNPVPEPDK